MLYYNYASKKGGGDGQPGGPKPPPEPKPKDE